ncbi:unnamed protein product, partial [Ectocarpus sp. 4 AP-2014]
GRECGRRTGGSAAWSVPLPGADEPQVVLLHLGRPRSSLPRPGRADSAGRIGTRGSHRGRLGVARAAQ